MMKFKKIYLKNYCGYKDFELNLYDESKKEADKWVIFFGPNGIGKSNFIKAVNLLTHPMMLQNRDNSKMLRSLKFNKEYISQNRHILSDVTDMKIEAVFVDKKNKEKRLVIEDTYKGMLTKAIIPETLSAKERELWEWDRDNAISGITQNDIPDISSFSFFIDADHPNNMHIFQLYKELKKPFLDFAEAVYGFKCFLPDDCIHIDQGFEFYTDFVMEKPNGTRVHYKSFSDGEKKIATLLGSLFKRAYKTSHGLTSERIILIDNIEMHIYWKRHMLLIEKMNEYFPEHQIICTTHSPIIIKEMEQRYIHDLEKEINNK